MGVKQLTIRSSAYHEYLGALRVLQMQINANTRATHAVKAAVIIPEGPESAQTSLDNFGCKVTPRIVQLVNEACAKYDRLMDDVAEQLKNEAA